MKAAFQTNLAPKQLSSETNALTVCKQAPLMKRFVYVMLAYYLAVSQLRILRTFFPKSLHTCKMRTK